MQTPKKAVFDLGGKVRVYQPVWPERELEIQPGDLSTFAPSDGIRRDQDRRESNPFTRAPAVEACGGTIYFGNDISQADFEALMRITEVQPASTVKPSKHFAAFTAVSEQPGKDGYLTQMRVVSKFGLCYMFGALKEDEAGWFPEQGLTMAEAFWSFIECERQRWGTSFLEDGQKGLRGLFGGDGDGAREELSFGFMVESDYHHVYRIWSRAWLVTK